MDKELKRIRLLFQKLYNYYKHKTGMQQDILKATAVLKTQVSKVINTRDLISPLRLFCILGGKSGFFTVRTSICDQDFEK